MSSDFSIHLSKWKKEDLAFCVSLKEKDNLDRAGILQKRKLHLKEKVDPSESLPSRFDSFTSDSSMEERLARSGFNQHFVYIRVVDRDILEFESKEMFKLKFLRIVDKVIHVILFFIPILMALAFMYTSIWLPLVVGIPTFLALALLNSKVISPKIEIREHLYNSLIYLRRMLKEHSFKSLHPIGEWDLPDVDKKLNSDLMMKEELKKKHPKSTRDIELAISHIDLDVSQYAKVQAARELNQTSQLKPHFDVIQKGVNSAKHFLHTQKFEEYNQAINHLTDKALDTDAIPISNHDLPLLSLKEQVLSLVSRYAYFYQLFTEVEKTYQKTLKLYEGLPESKTLSDNWENTLLKIATETRDLIKPVVDFSEKSAEEIVSSDWLKAASYIEESKLTTRVSFLIGETHQMQDLCKGFCMRHPQVRLEKFEEQLKVFDKSILSASTLNILLLRLESDAFSEQAKALFDPWKKENKGVFNSFTLGNLESKAANKPGELECLKWVQLCFQAIQKSQLVDSNADEELKKWLKAHPDLISESLKSIYERNFAMRLEWNSVSKEFITLKDQLGEVLANPTTHYQPFIQAVNTFYEGPFTSAKKKFGWLGVYSHVTRFRKAVFRKPIPLAKPFKEIKIKETDSPFLIHRKIEQMHIERLLKDVDKKMLYTNRTRQYGIHVAVAVFLIAEACILFYSSNSWISWGFTTGIAGLQASSIFIKYLLKKMDQKKLALKFQNILKDHPEITRAPGNRPKLEELKSLQERQHLDGVALTWGRVLAEGDEVLEKSRSSIAKEGKQQVHSYLEKRWMILDGYLSSNKEIESKSKKAMRSLEKSPTAKKEPSKKGEILLKLEQNLAYQRKELEKSLSSKPSKSVRASIKTDYEKSVLKRNEIEKDRDALWDKIKEAKGDLSYFKNFFYFIALLPSEIWSFVGDSQASKWLLNRQKMIEILEKSLSEKDDSQSKPEKIGEALLQIGRKISEGAPCETQDEQLLKTVPSSVLKAVIYFLKQANEYLLVLQLIDLIENVESTQEAVESTEDVHELLSEITICIRSGKEISENLLFRLQNIPKEKLDDVKKVFIASNAEIKRQTEHRERRILNQVLYKLNGWNFFLFQNFSALRRDILATERLSILHQTLHEIKKREDDIEEWKKQDLTLKKQLREIVITKPVEKDQTAVSFKKICLKWDRKNENFDVFFTREKSEILELIGKSKPVDQQWICKNLLELLCQSWDKDKENFEDWNRREGLHAKMFFEKLDLYQKKNLYWVLPKPIRNELSLTV